MAIRRTPKVFNSSYRPPRSNQPGQYRSLKPLIWLVIVAVVIILVGRLPIFIIKQVMVEGSSDQAVIAALGELKGHSIFSRFIGLTVEQVRAANLNIETVDCKRGIPDTIRCQITPRQPALIWRHNNQSWLVDGNGYVYAEGGEAPALPVIEDRGPTAVVIGQTVASQEVVGQYRQLIQDLGADGYSLSTIFITESLYQINVMVAGNTKPEIAWTPAGPITVMFVTTYALEAQRQALKEIINQKKTTITERIDLRVPGYVYTK